jgi:hypothetical protein
MRIIGNNPAADNAEITAVASGTLPNGKAVIVNADGTVSVVEGDSPSQNVGTKQTFYAGTSTYISSVYDPVADRIVVVNASGSAFVGEVGTDSVTYQSGVAFNGGSSVISTFMAFDSGNNKILIVYSDGGNSSYGTAVVGTVSGNSISFGTEVVFNSATTREISCAYDTNAGKFLIGYRDYGNSSYGTAIVATISGTSVSFGTAAVFESDTTQSVSAVYDITNQKSVITYAGGGTQVGYARVATISGTSVSFGSRANTSGGGSYSGFYSNFAYDPDTSKIITVYSDLNSSTAGRSVVGTVSGTDISYGSSTTFDSGGTEKPVLAYNSAAQKMAVFWGDTQDSRRGEIALGTVGATVDWANAVTIQSSGREDQASIVYDSTGKRLVCLYMDSTNSNYGTSVVFTAAYSSTTLTAENFIGFANGAAADTGTARVQIGSGINGAQSSLTAGQQYFVQTDGTLGLTAADPSVIAGTAISATEIIIKG